MAPLQSAGVDGITNTGIGWTDQSTTPYSSGLESSTGPNESIFSGAAQSGYLGWTGVPADAISTFSPATATTYAAKIFVSAPGLSTKVDVNASTVGTVSAAYFALYTLGGTQIAATAESHAAWAANRNSLAWTSSVSVQGGQYYYVMFNLTWSVQPILSAMTVSAVQNFGPVNGVSGTQAFLTTGTNTVPLVASYTMTSGTASALAIPFIGIF